MCVSELGVVYAPGNSQDQFREGKFMFTNK